MKKLVVPFSILPQRTILSISKKFTGFGNVMAKTFPYLKLELRQAEISLSEQEYGAIMFFQFLFYFVLISVVMFLVGIRVAPENALALAFTVGGIIALLVLVQLSLYPRIQVKKKIRDLERNLVFALRTMLVEIKSGVSLFEAINTVSQGDFGQVSIEFKKAVDEINTGAPEEIVLQRLAMDNPSLFFRRALWQLVNGLKAGGDVSDIMAELVSTIGREQKIQINRYGGSLRIFSLMYMMLGVIIPALGLTFMVILLTFPQISAAIVGAVNNSEALNGFLTAVAVYFPGTTPAQVAVYSLFWGFLAFIALSQFMFIGLMKTNRPNLIGEQ